MTLLIKILCTLWCIISSSGVGRVDNFIGVERIWRLLYYLLIGQQFFSDGVYITVALISLWGHELQMTLRHCLWHLCYILALHFCICYQHSFWWKLMMILSCVSLLFLYLSWPEVCHCFISHISTSRPHLPLTVSAAYRLSRVSSLIFWGGWEYIGVIR